MATLHADDVTDIVNSTLRDLGRAKITDITSDLQEHIAMNQLMRKNRVNFQSGRGIQWNLLTNTSSNARHVGLFDVDNTNQVDGSITGNIPWRHAVNSYTWDVRQLAMNSQPAQIVSFIKEKRMQALLEWVGLMEETFWGEPDSSTDVETPFGIKYWNVYNATEGFNGGNNSNFSSGPGNVNRTTYPRTKNYSGLYTNVSKTDLIRKMRKAATFTGFKPALRNMPIGDYATGHRYGFYTTYDNLYQMEEAAEDQNDSLGRDLASMDGQVLFRRLPVTYVPYLEQNEATADPVVGIDWGVFKAAYLKGRFLLETKPKEKSDAHNVMQVFFDTSYNFVCYDCRRLILLAKSTWH